MSKQQELIVWIRDEITLRSNKATNHILAHSILEQIKEEIVYFNSEVEDNLLAVQEENRKLREAFFILKNTMDGIHG